MERSAIQGLQRFLNTICCHHLFVLNPARSVITILNKSGDSGPFNYFLYNTGGQILLKGSTQMGMNGGAALPLPQHIPAGIYVLDLSNDKIQFRQKILVER